MWALKAAIAVRPNLKVAPKKEGSRTNKQTRTKINTSGVRVSD